MVDVIHIPSADDWREIERVERKLDSINGPGVTNAPDAISIAPTTAQPQPPRPSFTQPASPHIITAVQNDSITAQPVDAEGTAVGTARNIARPYKLRTQAANFPEVDSISVASPNRVTASAASEEDEVWEVRPYGYEVGDIVYAQVVAYTGITIGEDAVRWLDINVDARAWAVVTEETEIAP